MRLTLEDWLVVCDAAFAEGLGMGPMVAKCIQRRMKHLKEQAQAKTNP